VGAIVDADGSKFAEDVLAEQAVETYPQGLLDSIQIHHADALANPGVAFEAKGHAQVDGLARKTGGAAIALGERQHKLISAVGSYVDDGVDGARVE